MIEANISYVPGWESTAARALQLGYKAVVVGTTCKGDATRLETLLPSRDELRASLLRFIAVCLFFLMYDSIHVFFIDYGLCSLSTLLSHLPFLFQSLCIAR